MSLSYEYEIKSKIDLTNVKLMEFIGSLGEPIVSTTISDIYYDTSEYKLFSSGVFIRVRNEHILEIKQDTDENLLHTTTAEYKYVFPLDIDDSLDVNHYLNKILPVIEDDKINLFERYNLKFFVKINKVRRRFEYNGLIISLDDLSDLGNFIEIECSNKDKFSEIEKLKSSLGLTNLKLGYVELRLKKDNHDAFKYGRYL